MPTVTNEHSTRLSVRHAAAVTGSALLVFGLVTVGVVLALRTRPLLETHVTGAVLTANDDPRKQMPVANARITAATEVAKAETTSDSSGYFSLTLRPAVRSGRPVSLTFEHGNYRPLDMEVVPDGQIVLARMTPLQTEIRPHSAGPPVVISDIRIRYTVKVGSNQNVGTVVRTFQVLNRGGIACKKPEPCSPDGRWAASTKSFTLRAPEQNEFQSVRVTCIAGPCPFTKVDSTDLVDDNRVLRISATAWSDTATFLVEADLVHTIISDMVRQAYPVIFGSEMSFTLPGTAGGPSIEAELNGSYIVFPLGPDLILSWATCSLKQNPDGSKLYSCELKPGYRFQ